MKGHIEISIREHIQDEDIVKVIEFDQIATCEHIRDLVKSFNENNKDLSEVPYFMQSLSIFINNESTSIEIATKKLLKKLNKDTLYYEIRTILTKICNEMNLMLSKLRPSATKYNLAEFMNLVKTKDVLSVETALKLIAFSKIVGGSRSNVVVLRVFGGGRVAIKKTNLTAYFLKGNDKGVYYLSVNTGIIRVFRAQKSYNSVLKVLFL